MLLLWALCFVIHASAANGVIISQGDGTDNTSSNGFFGWDYVGQVNGESGTYLGFGYVITNDHVGPGDFILDGVTYPWIPGLRHSTRKRMRARTRTSSCSR